MAEAASWGDIILFKCVNSLSSLQRTITGSEWDHVGLVVPTSVKRDNLGILESTKDGVTILNLERRIAAYANYNFCENISIRRLNCTRTEEMKRNLFKFVSSVSGKVCVYFYRSYSLCLLSQRTLAHNAFVSSH